MTLGQIVFVFAISAAIFTSHVDKLLYANFVSNEDQSVWTINRKLTD